DGWDEGIRLTKVNALRETPQRHPNRRSREAAIRVPFPVTQARTATTLPPDDSPRYHLRMTAANTISETSPSLAGVRVAFVGRLAGLAKRDAAKLAREQGATVLDAPSAGATLVVI